MKRVKCNGFTSLELIISILILTIIISIVLSISKQIYRIEKIKYDDQKKYENIYYSLDTVIFHIKNRDKSYPIAIQNKSLIYKHDGIYYKLEFYKQSLYISNGVDKDNMKNKNKLIDCKDVLFEKRLNIMLITIIKIENNKKINYTRMVSLI